MQQGFHLCPSFLCGVDQCLGNHTVWLRTSHTSVTPTPTICSLLWYSISTWYFVRVQQCYVFSIWFGIVRCQPAWRPSRAWPPPPATAACSRPSQLHGAWERGHPRTLLHCHVVRYRIVLYHVQCGTAPLPCTVSCCDNVLHGTVFSPLPGQIGSLPAAQPGCPASPVSAKMDAVSNACVTHVTCMSPVPPPPLACDIPPSSYRGRLTGSRLGS